MAAAAVADPELGEPAAEAAGGEGRAVVRCRGRARPVGCVAGNGVVDDGDRLVGAAAKPRLQATISRVQQSMIA